MYKFFQFDVSSINCGPKKLIVAQQAKWCTLYCELENMIGRGIGGKGDVFRLVIYSLFDVVFCWQYVHLINSNYRNIAAVSVSFPERFLFREKDRVCLWLTSSRTLALIKELGFCSVWSLSIAKLKSIHVFFMEWFKRKFSVLHELFLFAKWFCYYHFWNSLVHSCFNWTIIIKPSHG